MYPANLSEIMVQKESDREKKKKIVWVYILAWIYIFITKMRCIMFWFLVCNTIISLQLHILLRVWSTQVYLWLSPRVYLCVRLYIQLTPPPKKRERKKKEKLLLLCIFLYVTEPLTFSDIIILLFFVVVAKNVSLMKQKHNNQYSPWWILTLQLWHLCACACARERERESEREREREREREKRRNTFCWWEVGFCLFVVVVFL